MKVSFIVPCYNEAGNIIAFSNKIKEVFEKEYNYEIIFINDGSKDNTLSELKKLLNNRKQSITIIDFSRNFGKEAGIYAGLKAAKGEYVNIIDADLQQNPKYSLKMVEFLENNPEYDIVTAYQEERIENKFISFIKTCFYKLINKMSEIEFKNGASDFRMFRKKVVNSILELTEYYRFSKGIFSWVGYNVYYMPYKVEERKTGTTKWSFYKLFRYAMNGIISFSTYPLRISTILGLFFSLLSILYLITVIIQKLFFQINVEGYATIVTLILLLGGIQLLCIGIIGEYIARTYVEVKRRPVYIVKDIISSEGSKKNHEKN